MLRRVLLVVISLTIALAVPTAAEANWWVRLPKKPKKVHVIALRRNHHIIWKDRTHGRRKKRIHLGKKAIRLVKLSSDFSFLHGIRAASDPAQISISTGYCPTTPRTDGVAYYLPYGIGSATTGLFSDMLTCFGGGGPSTEWNVSVTPPFGCNFPGANGQTVLGNVEYANFLDGEWTALCSDPQDTSATPPGSLPPGFQVTPVVDLNGPFQLVGQGFTCQDTVAVGASGNTPDNIRNQDSIEIYESLPNNMYSVTTSCIGNLNNVPGKPQPPNTVTTHWVACLEYNPGPGKPSLTGYGVSVTYPDGQYSEVCNDPNYQP